MGDEGTNVRPRGRNWRHWARTRRQQRLTSEVLTGNWLQSFGHKNPFFFFDDGLLLLLLKLEVIRRQVGSISAQVAKARVSRVDG